MSQSGNRSEVVNLEPGDVLGVGDLVNFDGEPTDWTARAITKDGRYAICTASISGDAQPVAYTIVDWDLGLRGAMSVSGGGLGIETIEGPDANIDEAVWMLEEGGFGVSHRNSVPLLISGVVKNEP